MQPGESYVCTIIGAAREILKDNFCEDKEFLRAYIDNIAMRLYDLHDGSKGIFFEKDVRDDTALSILKLIFSLDFIKTESWKEYYEREQNAKIN